MTGMAGYFGPDAENTNTVQARQMLAFTDKERGELLIDVDFWGFASGHEAQTSRCPQAFQDEKLTILIDGYILGIEGFSINPARPTDMLSLCAHIFHSEGPWLARRLNGSFNLAIFDKVTKSLYLICDRLATRYLYYMQKNGGVAFSSRLEALQAMGMEPTLKLKPEGFVEFMVFSRPLASAMWEGVRVLPAATIVSFHSGRCNSQQYWEMKFTYEDNKATLEENAHRLAYVMKRTVDRFVAGYERVGLLLSGGLDSRAVLACLSPESICYVACDRMNLETRIAFRAAKLQHCRFVPLLRPANHYYDILPRAVSVSHGCNEYHGAHLENLYHIMDETREGVVLTGHLFNRLIRGGDLPLFTLPLGGRSYSLPILLKGRLKHDFATFLMQMPEARVEASFVLSPSLRRNYSTYLQYTYDALTAECLTSASSPNQLLELYGFRHARAHTTSTFLLSLQQNVNERYVALDSNLVDLILSIPPEQRFNSYLLKRTLAILNPRLASLVDANTMLPATTGPWLSEVKPLKRLYDRSIIHIGKRTSLRHVPVWTLSSGSWHNLSLFWRYGPLAGRLEELLADEAAMRDEVVDPSAAREMISRHRSGRSCHTFVLCRLITFLEWRASNP